jgi:O-glycosyl hydrolase
MGYSRWPRRRRTRYDVAVTIVGTRSSRLVPWGFFSLAVAGVLACGSSPTKPLGTGGAIAAGGSLGGAGAGGNASSSLTGSGGSGREGGASGTGGIVTAGGGSGSGGGPANAGGSSSDAAMAGGAPDGGGVLDGFGAGGRSAGGAIGSGGAAATGGSGAGGRPAIVATPGSTLVKVDLNTKHQTFEGWGTSLAWWAYEIGGWSSAKKNQFLDQLVDPINGLGYNVFRYNIGGGDAPSHNHMEANREMPGFESSNGTWDWNADARQTSVLSHLVSAGKNVIIEAFANSPPYWMTKSGCASGSTDGSNNLKDDSYDAFASYLVTVTKHYGDVLGIHFRTLEPLNEPNANWWKANGSQEGCHFSASNQQQIVKAVATAITAQGITDTHVSASDENSMDDAYSILSGYDTASMAALGQLNVHSYAGSKRTQLHSLAVSKGKRLWQSESGPLSVTLSTSTDAAIFMAGRIIQDLRELEPQAWVEWQVVDPATTWTSFTVNDSQETWQPVKRFYGQAAFSRFIRPGAVFVDINDANMVAALSSDKASVTIVVRNGDSSGSKGFTFDLTTLPSVGAKVEVYRTSATEDLAHLTAVPVQNWSFTATVPAYSVTTYVIAL